MSGNLPLDQCFKEAEETGRLNLSGKNLRDFPDPTDDYELIDVIEADLSRNRLSELPEELCDFIMVEKIDLYCNSIRGVPDSQLCQLKYLRSLNLRRNQIWSFPVALCSLPLQVLNLSNNRLTSLPVEMGRLTLLQDLDLSSNKLSHLPNSVGEMISLKDLNIRRNRLEVLPDELSKLKLVRLDFSHNKVSVIPPAYRLITTLSVLELAHNPLTSPPAQVCTKGRMHIFKYLSVTAQQQEKRRTFDREIIRTSLTRIGSNNSVKDDSPENNLLMERVRRTHSLDSAKNAFFREAYDKEVYRPSSLRERERTRPQLSNVFETEEKRQKKVQREIEKAQQLILADALVGDETGMASKPDEELSEGEELEKEFLQIEAEQRKKKEEEERQIEERRNAARRIQSQHEEMQLQRQADIRRKRENMNGLSDRRKPQGSSSFGGVDSARPPLPERPSYKVLTRSGFPMEPSSPEPESPDIAWSRQEEELRARKREALMQQSRRDAQLSRSRFEEHRLKGKQLKTNSHTASLSRDASGKRFGGKGNPAIVFDGSEPIRQSTQEMLAQEREAWEEAVFPNLQVRQSAAQVRSLPSTFRDKANPNFTIKRMYDTAREEFEQLEMLRQGIESRLKVTLPDDVPAALSNGVVLCHLINHIRKGMIPSIHIPSAGVPKLTMPKCQKNVDSFLEACRKLGVPRERLCSPADILEEKSPLRVCQTVESLLEHADISV